MATVRPVIGIATQTLEAMPGDLPRCWVMSQRYVRVLSSHGAVPWLIPLQPDDPGTLREVFDRLDGVFLTGGVDVDPSSYGEARQSFCGRTDPDRDAIEVQLIRWCLGTGKPLLAVCRGIQVVNVACGGSLYQDIAAQVPGTLKHDYFPSRDQPRRDYLAHPVAVERDTRLAAILGEDRVMVNSMHHQSVKVLAPGLRASAFAPDGVIEAAEGCNGQYLIAVQWHPEELTDRDPGMRRLFTTFLEASTDFAADAASRQPEPVRDFNI